MMPGVTDTMYSMPSIEREYTRDRRGEITKKFNLSMPLKTIQNKFMQVVFNF